MWIQKVQSRETWRDKIRRARMKTPHPSLPEVLLALAKLWNNEALDAKVKLEAKNPWNART